MIPEIGAETRASSKISVTATGFFLGSKDKYEIENPKELSYRIK